ncbi:GIY-YIG nuclease family protein [Anaerostipes sp. MSJ-23]|uniref:GIY-YIG nuclease family protein n=1 Tax=unclassified Anaerostipes TaxID=2635253 RepID=UPI001C10E7AA|nr:GIY-YIG nuclease family protein [Anaerostipes sp. MSJ-23]
MKNYTYILKCKDESLYTGWTNDIEHRIKMHNAGKGAKYTRGRGPVELVYLEIFDSKKEAMSQEARIKKLSRKEKLLLIESYQQELEK